MHFSNQFISCKFCLIFHGLIDTIKSNNESLIVDGRTDVDIECRICGMNMKCIFWSEGLNIKQDPKFFKIRLYSSEQNKNSFVSLTDRKAEVTDGHKR